MSNDKKRMLEDFAIKAAQRLQDKKVTKLETYYIPSLESEVKIRNLTTAEMLECNDIADKDKENNGERGDRYTVYLAVVEPNLKDLAQKLRDSGDIKDNLEVMDIFNLNERNELALEIFKLSGIMGESIRKVNPTKES